MPFQYSSPSREGTRSLGLSCRFGPWQRSQEGPMPCGRPAFRQSCGLECLEYDILDWACRQRAVAGLWGARWYHRRAIKECVLSDKISRRFGFICWCTDMYWDLKSSSNNWETTQYTGWKCIIVPLALLFSHRLQYTLFGNMMFLFEGRWIVDCSKYSDRQPLRSFFDKQARLKCTVANAKQVLKHAKKRLRTSKSQTFKNNECVLKWLPISVLYIYIYRLLAIFVVFLSTSTMHSSSVSALWVCELVPEVILRNVYMTLVLSSGRCCLTGRRCWSNPNINQEVYIYIYIHCMYTSIFGPLMALPGSTHEI